MTLTSPTAAAAPARPASPYGQLLAEVQRAGLLERPPVRSALRFVALGAAAAAGLTGFLWLGDSWLQLALAAFVGVVFAQVGFLGHDAGHQQIFRTRRWNDRLGLVLSNLGVGLSYGRWVDKHSRITNTPTIHTAGGLALLLAVLSPVRALVFVVVQQSAFGLYLGSTFAPTHKGMRIIDAAARPDFLRRQVLTSRSVAGGRLSTVAFGGLNYQIEHHLFPSMPSRNLRRCRALVKAFCQAQDVPYTETRVLDSYRRSLRYRRSVRPDLRVGASVPTGRRGSD